MSFYEKRWIFVIPLKTLRWLYDLKDARRIFSNLPASKTQFQSFIPEETASFPQNHHFVWRPESTQNQDAESVQKRAIITASILSRINALWKLQEPRVLQGPIDHWRKDKQISGNSSFCSCSQLAYEPTRERENKICQLDLSPLRCFLPISSKNTKHRLPSLRGVLKRCSK